MWKTIVLSASLFAGAAFGLAAAASWIDASALPAAAALSLCVIGVVLILAAPKADRGYPPADFSESTDHTSGAGSTTLVDGRGRDARGLPIPNSRIL